MLAGALLLALLGQFILLARSAQWVIGLAVYLAALAFLWFGLRQLEVEVPWLRPAREEDQPLPVAPRSGPPSAPVAVPPPVVALPAPPSPLELGSDLAEGEPPPPPLSSVVAAPDVVAPEAEAAVPPVDEAEAPAQAVKTSWWGEVRADAASAWTRPSPLQLVLGVGSVIVWLVGVWLSLGTGQPPEMQRLGGWLWAASMAFFVAAIVARRETRAPTIAALPWTRLEIGAVIGLTLLAFLSRVYLVGDIPFPIQGDEGSIGMSGLRWLNGQVSNFFVTGWSEQPILSYLPTALFLWLLGPDVAATRMLSAIEAALTVPLLYCLGRRMFGPLVGFLSALFLLGWAYHIHFSRLGWYNVGDAFWAALVFWLTYRATQSQRQRDYLWAGVAAGLAWYSYLGARLVCALALFYVVLPVIRDRRYLARNWSGILTMLAAIAIVAGPQIIWFSQHPGSFMARISSMGTLQSGWLQRESQQLGVSPLQLTLQRTWDTFQVYTTRQAIGGFFESDRPLLEPLAALLFIVGMLVSFVRFFEPRHIILLTWFFSVLVASGGLTIDTPWHRMLLSAPAVCIWLALALKLGVDLVKRVRVAPRWLAPAVSIALVAALSARSADYYFRDFIPSNRFVTYGSELGQIMGYYLRGLGGQYNAYFGGAPRIFFDFPSIPYLAPAVPKQDMAYPLTADNLPLVPPGRNAVFMVIPPRRADLDLIARRYPGGVFREFPSVHPNEMLYYSYEVQNPR